MKAIMISIKPKHVADILNGKKTIEIRKTCPQVFKNLKPCEGCSIDVYIYCTKEDTLSILTINRKDIFTIGKDFILNDFGYLNSGYEGKGKVVAKFTLNKVGIIHDFLNGLEETEPSNRHITISTQDELLSSSCLTQEEFDLLKEVLL